MEKKVLVPEVADPLAWRMEGGPQRGCTPPHTKPTILRRKHREGTPATLNNSRTNLGPSPRYFWISSLPTTRKNVAAVWFATAFASRVFPVPGAPYRMASGSERPDQSRDTRGSNPG